MIALFCSKWERLWKRKTTRLFLAAIPVIVLATARYYAGHNRLVPAENAEHTYAANFPAMAMIEQLMVAFNTISLVLLTFSFTEEARTGQLRLVLLRAYPFGRLFRAKAAAYGSTMGLFFLVYLAASIIVGAWLFPSEDHVSLFYHDRAASSAEVFLYTLEYYGLAWLSVLGTGSVFIAIAVASPTTTTSIGLSLGFLFVSFGFPTILQVMNAAGICQLSAEWQFLSLTQLQYKGIAMALGETAAFSPGHMALLFALVLTGYMVLFATGAYWMYTKSERWI